MATGSRYGAWPPFFSTLALTTDRWLIESSPDKDALDRKSTRLNSSHVEISYAVFCDHRALHSFPTRRSSDLGRRWWESCQAHGAAPTSPPRSAFLRSPRPWRPGRDMVHGRHFSPRWP